MMNREECEATLLAHLEWLRRAMAALCRRCGATDVDDFVSWATLRLIENDYEILRRFRGESGVRTYLTVVLRMLHRDYRSQCWGRWRPSAAARRHGPLAVELETLVHRDHVPLRQAVLVLRACIDAAPSERDLLGLYATLPLRTATPRDGAWRPLDAVETASADAWVTHTELAAERGRVATLLARALAALSSEEQQVLRMRYWEGLTIAEIARRLGVPQKPLYRRVERALGALRGQLERAGVSRYGALALLTDQAA